MPQQSINTQRVKKVLFGDIDISNRLITQTDLSFAFPSKMPILPGHILICPFRRIEKMEELTKEELYDLFSLIANIKSAHSKEFDATGFNTAWNENIVAGQTVPHLHVHIVPRNESDKSITDYEPRQFLYRPGLRECSPEEELANVAIILGKHFKRTCL